LTGCNGNREEQTYVRKDSRGLKSVGLLITRVRALLLAGLAYSGISIFLLWSVITSRGDVTGQDWNIPITASAANSDFHQFLYVWQYNGFGGQPKPPRFGFPFLYLVQTVLAPLGFVGGNEIKVLSVFLVALGGVTTYVLAQSFRMKTVPSFVAGLFYMTTPILFNWLIFGSIFYIIGYDLLPFSIFLTKKFLDTNNFRYALVNGLVLAVVLYEPTLILIYPTLSFIFVLFECRAKLKAIIRGLGFILVSILVWVLSALTFFVSYNNGGTLSFYQGEFLSATVTQFLNLTAIINPMRFWGGTFNKQFETFFPQSLVLFSFLPLVVGFLALLFRPRKRQVLFFSVAYIFVFAAFEISLNLPLFVTSFRYGAVFEAPSIFLVPASLGLSLLIGTTTESASQYCIKLLHTRVRGIAKIATVVAIVSVIIIAGFPWWTGQLTGDPGPVGASRLNLYEIPQDYYSWTSATTTNGQHFVLYLPLQNNIQINNTQFFSNTYQGVNRAILTDINDLPYVSVQNSTLLLNDLLNGDRQFAITCGFLGIGYIVVVTNAIAQDNGVDLTQRLSQQNGLVKVLSYPDVIVFEDMYATAVVYGFGGDVHTQITYQDPTSYKLISNSTTSFYLVLDQSFANGWTATVDGIQIPSTDHIDTPDGLNSWFINQSGKLNIVLYYQPQTEYFASFVFSIVFLIGLSAFLVVEGLRNIRSTLLPDKRMRFDIS
jgi:hypothetical protein